MNAVDLFAGGGGASLGIELAGHTVDHAVNHWPTAINVHALNHKGTTHHIESVWRVRPILSSVDMLWASPDCTHFSRAKAGRPRQQKIRSLAWSVVSWATHTKPRLIVVENVPEFATWGPLDRDGSPVVTRRGRTFRAWVRKLQRLDYAVDWRVLSACDYGAPTTRKRLYVVARRDGALPRWPEATHGPGRAMPWRAAADAIDWSIPCPSIFERDRPLAKATLARIARGIQRFVLDDPSPFVVGESIPTLIHVSNGERQGQAPRVYDIRRPLGTVVAGGIKQAVVVAFLARHFGGRGTVGSSMREPLRTVTARDHHALVTAFLLRHHADGVGSVATVGGELYRIADIGMRLLTPRELARAQGFPDEYVIERGADGRSVTRTDQVRLIGNSVCPPVARAITEANQCE